MAGTVGTEERCWCAQSERENASGPNSGPILNFPPPSLSQEQGELEFRRGDVITVTDRSDQHWWTGELGNRRGLFPATYVTPYHT